MESSVTYRFPGLHISGKEIELKRQPDVSFVSLVKMPEPLDEELLFASDLAVEVVSRNDALYEVETKVKEYQYAWSG